MGSLLATLHCWTRSHVPDSCSIPGWHLPHQPVPEEKTFYKTSVRLCPCVFLLHGPSHKDKKDPSGTAGLKGQKTAENPPLGPSALQRELSSCTPCCLSDVQQKPQLAQNPWPSGIWAAEKRHLSGQRGPKW